MKAFIKAISYYLPRPQLTNEMLEKQFPEWSVDKISAKTGISNRHIAANDETSADMAFMAAEKLFAEHKIDKTEIDFLILCTQSPDYFLPTTACILQEKLGLNTNIGAFDFNLGCSGFVYGMGIAKGLIMSGQARNVLLITSETYSKFIHPKDKSNRTIFGDAAAATLISTEGFAGIGNFSYGTDGKGAKNLIVANGGMRNPEISSETKFDEYDNAVSDDYLFMDGAEIFLFTLSEIPKLIKQTLSVNNLDDESADLYILHQANKYMLETLRKKLKIEIAKFYINLEDCGNTVSSTIPIALYRAQNENLLKENSNIVLAGFGVGYSWAGTVINIKKNKNG